MVVNRSFFALEEPALCSRKVPVRRSLICSHLSGCERQRTTTPLMSWPADSCSLPRKTIKSFSRLAQWD